MGASSYVSTLTAGLCVSVDSQKHIPSFIDNAKEIKSKGVSDIIVISGLWLANALSWFLYGCDQWFCTRRPYQLQLEITLYKRFLECLNAWLIIWFGSCSPVGQWMTSMWWRHGSNPTPAMNISSSWQMGQASSQRHWTWCLTSARRVWATAPEDTLSLSTTSRWRLPTSKKEDHLAFLEERTSLKLWRLRKLHLTYLQICSEMNILMRFNLEEGGISDVKQTESSLLLYSGAWPFCA